MAKECLLKALDEEKINTKYCTFLDRQSSNMGAIKDIFEEEQKGYIYFDAVAFEKENINDYETKRVWQELLRIRGYVKTLKS